MNKHITILLLTILCTGCSFDVEVMDNTPAPTIAIITDTLAPSQTPPPSLTVPPPAPSATTVPVAGVTSAEVNIRALPSTTSEVLGTLLANSPVQIIGTDPGGNWWLILYPQHVQGNGWVSAQFITTESEPNVPVIGGTGTTPDQVTAVIQQQLNIRSGPGSSFNAIGTLNPQDVVTLTGKDPNGTWLQIDFAAGPDGKAWVSAAFIQATNTDSLPIIGVDNTLIGTGTPTTNAPLSSPTPAPAPPDGDSAVAPLVNIVLTATGSSSFQYTSDVSSPTGDTDDWIQFKPNSPNILIELTCTGSESYTAELLQNNIVTQTLVCNKTVLLLTDPTAVYAIHFTSIPAAGLQYTRFTLRVDSTP